MSEIGEATSAQWAAPLQFFSADRPPSEKKRAPYDKGRRRPLCEGHEKTK